MKKVLVVYFTQTGQLNKAVKATLAPFENEKNIEIHYEQIKPKTAYPFPGRTCNSSMLFLSVCKE